MATKKLPSKHTSPRGLRDRALACLLGMQQDQAGWAELLELELELAQRRVELLKRQVARAHEAAEVAAHLDALAANE